MTGKKTSSGKTICKANEVDDEVVRTVLSQSFNAAVKRWGKERVKEALLNFNIKT